MTKQQRINRIRKTNVHLKRLLKNKDFSKHSEDKLKGMLSFGEKKYLNSQKNTREVKKSEK